MAVCPQCARENPDDARFCNACGNPLSPIPGGAREERRIVTILFADLVGFTARAEQLDPEDVRAILQPYYARLRAELEAFGGTVEKFIGDAVMAVFGAPIAHGDDPERAVRAALAVRAAVLEMNADDPQLELQVRIAVNTGEAIVSLGAKTDLGEGMVAGDVVNTAARLQTAAPTNAVLVGADTYRATRALFQYEAVEPVVAKGKQAPLTAWLAVAAISSPGERVPQAIPMVGRLNELGALRGVFESVTAERRPHLLTIIGEGGIGKTRLETEFTGELLGRGARVLRGRALPYGASTMYGPFTQQVKQFAEIFASDDLPSGDEKLRAALTELMGTEAAADAAPHLELLTGLAAEGDVGNRQILFLAARRFVEALAAEQPTVLVFEDLHCADEGTLDLLEVLASRVRDVPLLLLAHSRPELLHSRPAWGGGLPAYTSLSLQTLDQNDARELAVRLLAAAGAGEVAASAVATKAEGNPLFIEELAASVAENTSSTAQALPTTIRELVSARLDALPLHERPVLLDAAVVGKVFWRGALELMSGNGADVSAALDALEARDLIRREPFSWIEREEQFIFKHELIRDVAYATLPRAERKERHAAVARFLEDATADAAATATALAQHWREAGDDRRALEYLVRAADQAARGWAKDEASKLYGEAIELLDPDDMDRRRDLGRKQAIAVAAALHVTDAQRLRQVEREPSGA